LADGSANLELVRSERGLAFRDSASHCENGNSRLAKPRSDGDAVVVLAVADGTNRLPDDDPAVETNGHGRHVRDRSVEDDQRDVAIAEVVALRRDNAFADCLGFLRKLRRRARIDGDGGRRLLTRYVLAVRRSTLRVARYGGRGALRDAVTSGENDV